MPDRHTTYQIRNGTMTPIASGSGPLPKPKKPTAMSREQEIKAAAEAARRKDPTLAHGYAASAIAAGKTVEQVKVELFDRLAGVDRRTALADMRERCGLPPDAA